MTIERIELLDGMIHSLESRLLSVKTPGAVLEHADRLEQRGKELIAQAESIREKLVRDTEAAKELEFDLRLCKAEQRVLRRLITLGIRVSSGVVRSELLRMMKEGDSDDED